MLFWESSAFVLFLVSGTVFLLWIYWRDLRRARALQAFFASVTHELRTPLTSIRLQAESIADDFSEEAGAKSVIRRLLEDTSRLEGQVERTLELARVEGGGPVFLGRVELMEALRRSVASSVGVKVEVSGPAKVWVRGDPMAVQVVARNILENVRRHSKSAEAHAWISVGVVENQVDVQFEDSGPGHSAGTSRLGELFEKGPTSAGTGVGLYLVRMLMERMRGSAEFAVQGARGFGVRLVFDRAEADAE